ncbi:hypothetical protein [Paenibacillus amylolyticus]|uniref:hypothetical protein n=1 Tax=Paenibacillus amylolyticus TaxID=1451 RepID=UPI003D8099A7
MDISGNFVYDDNYWKRWVSAIEGNTITLVAATGEVAIQPNTWALVHVRYGAATEAGLYDFVYITAVEDDAKLTLLRPPVSVQNGHILNATSVSIHACISDKQVNITQGSIITSNNLVGGSAGGIIPIICEELNLDGVVNVTGKGYRGERQLLLYLRSVCVASITQEDGTPEAQHSKVMVVVEVGTTTMTDTS